MIRVVEKGKLRARRGLMNEKDWDSSLGSFVLGKLWGVDVQ